MIKKPKSIRGRWILSGTFVMLAVALTGVLAYSLSFSGYLYTSVRTGLESKAKTASEFFTTYVSNSRAEYNSSVYNYTASFEDKDKLELQFVNTKGRVEISSYGISSGSSPGTPDIGFAIEYGMISSWTGRAPDTGERVMAVSSPLMALDGTVVGVMRYVTSLRLVDRQVWTRVLIVSVVGLALIAAVLLTNLLFIQSLIIPIRKLTAMAKSIAEGSYGAQVEKNYDDEIGELTDTINEMSLKLKRAVKVQTEFISSVSHELRTPLTAITGWSETIAYDPAITGDSRRGVGIISKEANRLTKMVEELLEFTRIQDGRFNLSIEQIDISAELEESIYAYRELLQQERIRLEYEAYPGEMPLIPGDPERLRQVFLNILDNAAKYGRDGGKIIVRIDKSDEQAVISIRDFGAGIRQEELPFVKKMFYKGSSRERGSGIGLAVCDEIVTRHKGALLVENARDGGVLVTIRLPLYAKGQLKAETKIKDAPRLDGDGDMHDRKKG